MARTKQDTGKPVDTKIQDATITPTDTVKKEGKEKKKPFTTKAKAATRKTAAKSAASSGKNNKSNKMKKSKKSIRKAETARKEEKKCIKKLAALELKGEKTDKTKADNPETIVFRKQEIKLKDLLRDYKRLKKGEPCLNKYQKKAIRRYYREEALKPYQAELIRMQKCLENNNRRMIILFEGRDAAGKGGTIRRVTRYMHETLPGRGPVQAHRT